MTKPPPAVTAVQPPIADSPICSVPYPSLSISPIVFSRTIENCVAVFYELIKYSVIIT